jgi:hypothetical protein
MSGDYGASQGIAALALRRPRRTCRIGNKAGARVRATQTPPTASTRPGLMCSSTRFGGRTAGARGHMRLVGTPPVELMPSISGVLVAANHWRPTSMPERSLQVGGRG